MNTIVLTGGTCGGKSTIISEAKKHFGNKIITIPEVATLLFQGEFTRPQKWSLEWHHSLQKAILKKQYELENKAKEEAREFGANVILCDRGMLDPAAYIEGGLKELVDRFGVDELSALQRYEMVIHIESLATLNPALYKKVASSNPHRVETVEESSRQELSLRKIWAKHPKRIHLASSLDENTKIVFGFISDMIEGIMFQK